MKRICAILLAVTLFTMLLVGCGGAGAVQSYVTIQNTNVTLGAAYDDALAAALGAPTNTEQAVSCHYDGFDTIYTYDGFVLYTYQLDAQQIIYSIELKDAALSTPEGAKVGMTATQIEEIYGADYEQLPNGISYPLDKNGAKLNFRIKDDNVFCIEYYTE